MKYFAKHSLANISHTLESLLLVIVSGFLSFTLVSCTDSTDSGSGNFNIQTISTQNHGEVLADADGNVLYYFTPDAEGNSTCEGDCINAWPVFHAESIQPEGNLNPANFGTTMRPDGNNQTTHLGWPLYYFSGDSQPGEVNGEAIESFGGIWHVAKPDYTIMRATQQLIGHDEQEYIINANGNYVEGEGTTTHFTDASGRTLYVFLNDSANTNTFTAEDFSNNNIWPIYEENLSSLPSSLNSSNFGQIDVFDRTQLTYKGWPLYYFGQDTGRGETKGITFPDQADPGLWPVAQIGMPSAPGYTDNSNNNDDGNSDY